MVPEKAESSWTEILSGQKFCLEVFFANTFFLNLFKYIRALILFHKTHPWVNSIRVKVTMAVRSMKSTLTQ